MLTNSFYCVLPEKSTAGAPEIVTGLRKSREVVCVKMRICGYEFIRKQTYWNIAKGEKP